MMGPFTRLDLEMQMVPARAAGRAQYLSTCPASIMDAEMTQVRVRRDLVVVSDLDEIPRFSL